MPRNGARPLQQHEEMGWLGSLATAMGQPITRYANPDERVGNSQHVGSSQANPVGATGDRGVHHVTSHWLRIELELQKLVAEFALCSARITM